MSRHQTVRLSIFFISAIPPFADELELYTAEVYNLRMCMKEDNQCPKKFKGDK